ncbi:ankyrin repeat-containing domain protein [Usnea florida]
MAVSVSGSDGAIDESGSDSIHQRDIASMMIEPTTTERDTSNISVPNVQHPLKRSNETIKPKRNPVKVQPKLRIRLSYLFDKLGWKSDRLDRQSKQLLAAAIAGDVSMVIDSLEKGAHIDYQDNEQRTALVHATKKGNEPVVRLLLENGANPECKSYLHDHETALTVAAFSGSLSISQLLLENGADIESSNMDGETSLIIAVRQGHQSVVQLLLEKGANFESTSMWGGKSINHAARYGHESIVRLLLEKGVNLECTNPSDVTPLMSAARYGHELIVQLLLEKGANIEGSPLTSPAGAEYDIVVLKNCMGEDLECTKVWNGTPLNCAARYGHGSVVQVLLEKGANIESGPEYGTTPLMSAARGGHESIVRLLLEKGANIESGTDYSTTPLMSAGRDGHESIVRLLLEKGANIESGTKYGETPLMSAARDGHESIVRLLLDKGANIHAKDFREHTALFHAKDNKTVANLLPNAGARY